MKYTNYHSHTHYCDGASHPEEYVKAAIEQGVIAYGFSSHAPVPFETEWTMKAEKIDAYLADIEQLKITYQGKIQLYKSLEIDFVPNKRTPIDDFIRSLNLDYTIGSVHFIDAYNSGKPWGFDGHHSEFKKGFEQVFNSNIQQVVERYFELNRLMVQTACPDIVGHLDKIKMYNNKHNYFTEEESWYQVAYQKTLETIKEAACMVEVNTRGIYKKRTIETYPGIRILKEILALDIPIVINSDCHHPREITAHFEETRQELKRIGFAKVQQFIDHQWISVDL